ncbi:HalX domain-containing protein [Halorussus litoreus]|uniref:HalX domain-containing protein n=1 Tax=Halorussus litoreus TaxID=1710536 RepID=UPI000E269263|nr:HalX domain-containing protein [Halorussus litoreus]
MSNDATVLIVDDEKPITDAYAQWLEDDFTVRTAYSGSEALEKLDESVDVVLLDRRMPDLSGEDVLTQIHEQGLTCRVALVSAVEPDFDILELGFDAYLEKPVSEADELLETVRALLRRSTYDAQMQQFLSLANKKAALETKKSPEELDASEEYDELSAELADLRGQLSATATTLDEDDLRAEFYDGKEFDGGDDGDETDEE